MRRLRARRRSRPNDALCPSARTELSLAIFLIVTEDYGVGQFLLRGLEQTNRRRECQSIYIEKSRGDNMTLNAHWISLLLAVLSLGLTPVAFAQNFPVKPIRILVGGGTDVVVRILGNKLTEAWGQQIVVDNRPGAGGTIAAEIAAQSPPDGYTLLLAAPTFAMNAAWRTTSYDHVKDFSAVVQIASLTPFILVVHPSLPVRSVQELIALAKSRPGELNFSSAQSGGPTHLSAELFKLMARIDIVHVPYKGVTNAILGVITGEVHLMFPVAPPTLPHIKSGKLRALAVTTPKRTRFAPEMPTVAESGLPGYEVTGWNGLVAPAGMPKFVVAKINAEVLRLLKQTDVQRLLETNGFEAASHNTPEEFGEFIRREIEKWAKLIKESGTKIQ